jgi:hypothetical protein
MVGRNSHSFSGSRLEMGLESDSGWIFGVVTLDFWEGPLKDAYPELIRLAKKKNALVGDHMDSHNGCIHWELQFSCSVQVGSWSLFQLFWTYYIQPKLRSMVRILLYGDSQEKKTFQLADFTKL